VVLCFDTVLGRRRDVVLCLASLRVTFGLDGRRYEDRPVGDLVDAEWEVLAKKVIERIQLQRGIDGLAVAPWNARIQGRRVPHVQAGIDDLHRVVEQESLVDQLLDIGSGRVCDGVDEAQLRDLILDCIDHAHDFLEVRRRVWYGAEAEILGDALGVGC